VHPNGLKVIRPGDDGYINNTIAPLLSIKGDFDIIVTFEQFDPKPAEGSSSAIYLQAVLNNVKANECLITRRQLRHRVIRQPIVQPSYVTREQAGARRARFKVVTTEATSGRLRLARRGETVYFLFAESDSPNFQLLATEAATKDNILSGNLRMLTQAQGEGLTKVVWKSITICADILEGVAFSEQEIVLAELDEQRHPDPMTGLPSVWRRNWSWKATLISQWP